MGGWLPRSDRASDRELYCASILALLKLWTSLSDLKTDTENFEEVFMSFLNNAPKKTLDIIENIQYYYECYNGAKKRRDMEVTVLETDRAIEYKEESCRDDLMSDSLGIPSEVGEVMEEDIDMMHRSRVMMRERFHAVIAMNMAFEYGVFPETVAQTVLLPTAKRALTEDLKTFQAWENQLKAVCRSEVKGGPALFSNVDSAAPAARPIVELPGIQEQHEEGIIHGAMVERPKRDLLKKEQ